MKFTKYNNPNKRRPKRKSPHSQAYINEQKTELFKLLAKAETEEEKDALIKAFQISIHP